MPPKEKLVSIIRQSVYAPEFYRELFSKPLGWSFKYFFSLILILALISAVVLGWKILPEVSSFLNSFAPAVLQYYPSELEVIIKGGTASSNVKEPYFLKPPPELKEEFEEAGSNFENLLVIDTKGEMDLAKLEEYNSVMVLTKEALIVNKSGGRIEIQPLRNFPDLTINQKTIADWLEGLKPLMKFLGPILAVGMFLVGFCLLAFKLAYLLIAALLIWLIAKIKNVHTGYKKAYQVGLHAITFPLIAETFLKISFGGTIPFLFTALLLLTVWFNLEFQDKEPIAVPIAEPTPPPAA